MRPLFSSKNQRSKVKRWIHHTCPPLEFRSIYRHWVSWWADGSGRQISTKHLTTSIRPFFATCRLPQYPEFWRCVEPGILFLGPHCKRSLKSLDTLLKVPMRNTQLLPRPRKMVAVVLNIFFLGVYMFFIWGIQCGNVTVSDRGKWREIL